MTKVNIDDLGRSRATLHIQGLQGLGKMNSVKNFVIVVLLLSSSLYLFSCGEDDEDLTQSFNFDFEESSQGWTGDFTNYNPDWDINRFEFMFEHAQLPEEMDREDMSLMLSGRNISDNMFMFLKRQITNLKPNHDYVVRIRVELASQYPDQSVGIGGSPGASVFLKAGGSTIEPEPVEEDGYMYLNIDKGNQAVGGEDATLIGTVGIEGEEFVYTMIDRDNFDQPVVVRSDDQGSLWVVVGTDSGFEGTSTLFYNNIEVQLD